jgi:hypothetical protein
MGFFSDLLGTSKSTFKLGKLGTTIDGSLASINRTLTLPDSDVDFSGGSVGDVLTKTAGGLVMQTPGGSVVPTMLGVWSASQNYSINNYAVYGANLYVSISNNVNKQPDINPSDWQNSGIDFGRVFTSNTITSGTYYGSVLVIGTLTLNGDLTIYGNLVVTNAATPIANQHVNNQSLTVHGNIFAAAGIYLSGGTGIGNADGSNLTVKGSIVTGGSTYGIALNGGNVASGNGGNSGNLIVDGDVFLNLGTVNGDLALSGGTSTVVTDNGGNAGTATIGGNLIASGRITGNGTPTYTIAGTNGATISVLGSLYSGASLSNSLVGGAAKANSSQAGGNGGTVFVGGNMLLKSSLPVTGGAGGTGGGVAPGGNGGTITVLNDIICFGSATLTISGGAALGRGNGGNGGFVKCKSLIALTNATGTVTGTGGTAGGVTDGNGGNGGSVTVLKNLVKMIVTLSGGNAGISGSGGAGGNIFVGLSIPVGAAIILSGGTGLLTGSGGQGGNLVVTGDANLASFDSNGGAGGASGRGGDAGLMDIGGAVNTASSITMNGGNALVGNVNGNGGMVYLRGGGFCCTLSARDGNGTGSEPSGVTGNPSGVWFNGMLVVAAVTVPNRGGSLLVGFGLYDGTKAAILKVKSINRTIAGTISLSRGSSGATLTGAIASANVKIFVYDGAANWYAISGAGV